MLDKNITYEVFYEGVATGEIKGDIYCNLRGQRELEVRDNCLFDGGG